MRSFSVVRLSGVFVLLAVLAVTGGCRKRKYENPISKDTKQPDKVLYDKAIGDIERGRYEVARLTLQTLLNTYDTSEYLAKAKLAIADSWFREGGANGLAQAEAEYKDFILFYPTMEEAAESQEKVCMIHYRQMDKSDRDPNHAMRADEECRQVLIQFPNSKFAPRVAQLVRNIQESLAEAEFRVGDFYYRKESWASSTNRLQGLTDHYPLYSKADEALYKMGDGFTRMGKRFNDRAGKAFSRIVKDYPLSPYADDAKKRLKEMEMNVPDADPAAVERMKYEIENRTKASMLAPAKNMLKRGPDTRLAAKAGTPATTPLRPAIPVNIPVPAAAAGGVNDVTVSTVGDGSTLEKNPDARLNQGAGSGNAAGANPAEGAAAAATGTAPATTGAAEGAAAAPAAGTTAGTTGPAAAKTPNPADDAVVAKGSLPKAKKAKKFKPPKKKNNN